jgi:putative membrane protein
LDEGADAPPAEALAAPTALLELADPAPAAGAASPGPLRSHTPVDPFAAVPPSEVPPAPVGGAGSRGGWALAGLALVVLLLAPPGLGHEAAARLGTLAPAATVPALPAGDPVELSLVDYSAHAVAGGGALADRRVRLVGFVVSGSNGAAYLARFSGGCCAAGAHPVKVGLVGDLPSTLVPGEWVAVVGGYSELLDRDPVNGAPIPYLSVVEYTPVPAPPDPFD